MSEAIIEEVKTEVETIETYGAPENKAKRYRDVIVPMTDFYTKKEEELNRVIKKGASKSSKKEAEAIRIEAKNKRLEVNKAIKPMLDHIQTGIDALKGVDSGSKYSANGIEDKAVKFGEECDKVEDERILVISIDRHKELFDIGIEAVHEGLGSMSEKGWSVFFKTEKAKEEVKQEEARIAKIESDRVEAERIETERLKKVEDARIEAERVAEVNRLKKEKDTSDALLEKERKEHKQRQQKAIDEAKVKQDEQDKKDAQTEKDLQELADLRAEKVEREKPKELICETITEETTPIEEIILAHEDTVLDKQPAKITEDKQLVLFTNMITAMKKLGDTYVFTRDTFEEKRNQIMEALTEFHQEATEEVSE